MKRTQLWYLIGALLIAACTAKADTYTVVAPSAEYTAIANQLDNPGGTSLNVLLPIVPDGCELVKWDCAIQNFSSTPYTYWTFLGGWIPAGGTLGPGEGALFYNAGTTDINLTFVGTPRASAPASLPCGCGKLNFVSCVTATIGTYENITGKLASEGAVFARWDRNLFDWVYNTYSGGVWSLGTPTANVGESVLVNVPCNAPSYKWYQPPALGGGPTNIFNGWNQTSSERLPDVMNAAAADDWVCTNADPVTKVRWWGSFSNWQETNLPPAGPGLTMGFPNGFWIIFFTNVPAGQDLPWSHPATNIAPPLARFYTNYTWRYVGKDYDPRTGTYESCFLFEQDLPSQPFNWWFYQTNSPSGTNVYWLSIIANQWGWDPPAPPTDHFFGWKTRPRSPNSPAPDDAVTYNIDGYTFGSGYNWQPIWWPEPANSWDLAFELITGSASGKWEQLPDLSNNGMDVNATMFPVVPPPAPPYLLADDFQCTSTGPITNITIWGSWFHDYHDYSIGPSNISIVLSIHDDIPANSPPYYYPWSMPGAVKWCRTNSPAQYKCSVYATGLSEGWLDPPGGYSPMGDFTCFQYDFNFTAAQAFTQQGSPSTPVTYWLDVEARLPGNQVSQVRFGWKTSIAHWNDAAAWVNGVEQYAGPWQQLLYPPGHPQEPQYVDMAFRLNATSQQSTRTKWSQPPVPVTITNGYNGWNEYSVFAGTNIVADDWVCTNARPVTDIHWWGSFIGWTNSYLPPVMPSTFLVSIWSDIPKGAGVPFSHPGICLTNILCTGIAPTFVGWDYDPRNPGNPPDACFKFEQDLTPGQWFYQAPGTNTYWISIAAQYLAGPLVDYPWGWKTRPRDTNSLALDDAVRIFYPTAPVPGQSYQSGTNIWWPTTNSSWDMAFALTTSSNQCAPPTIICSNFTVQCGTAWGPPYAWDNCCNALLIPAQTGSQTNGYCPWVITETWKATDCTGQTNSCTRTVTVVDTIAPTVTCATNKTVQCGTIWSFDPPAASDSCCGTNVTVTVVGTTTNGYCPWVIIRTWKATDCCSNTATCSQTVTVVDTTPPTITCATNKTVQCGSAWSFDPPPASDTCCGTNVSIVVVGTTTNGFCPWLITRTWKATDCCSNSMTCSQTVTVVDTTPPTITCVTNKTVTAGWPWGFDPPTASDICCGTNVTINILSTVTNSPCPLTVTRTWIALDCCTNYSASCSQTVTVVSTNLPPADTNVLKYVQWPQVIGGYDVYDRTVMFLADDFLCTNTGAITDIHIWCSYLNDAVTNHPIWLGIWSDVPAVGTNISHPGQLLWQQTFTPDQYQHYFWGCGAEQYFMPGGAPFIYGPDSQVYYYVFYPTNTFVQRGTPANPTNYWLSGYCTDFSWFGWKTATNVHHDTAVWNSAPPGSSTNWAALKDPNFGTPLDLAFKITSSTNQCPPPTLACSNLTVQCGTAWAPPFAWDNCCNSGLTPTLTGSQTNGFCPWVITENWKATDCTGQTSTCSRLVTVVDTIAPTITCATNKTVQCGSTWFFDPPTASDTCCGTNVAVTVVGTTTNGYCPWVIIRTWKATDCCSNSITCSQTVTIVDTTPPTLICATNKTVQCGSAWSFDLPSASDICCGTNVTIALVGTTTNGYCSWLITRTWKATDCCSNTSFCSQTVTVQDTTPPTIICASNKTVAAGWPWSFDLPTATDACCSVTIRIISTMTNLPCPLTVTRTWVATDCCSNSATCSQTVAVVNTNLPPADTDAVKFVQWPKTVGGYDVYDRTFMFLADDFLCTNTGPITDIHIWCSYMNDMVTNPPIWLGIYSDVPATVNSNSHPGRLLWQQTFMPDQYRQYFWSCGAERFIAPGIDYGPDSQVLYYVFYPTNTFVQQGTPQYPTTYWLAVYCLDFSLFGWKTSTNAFQDAAVWGPWTGDPGSATTWQAMKDPLFGEPLNMAFKITTTTNPVPSSGVKFTQPPDLSTNGFDVRALRPKILADDFLCIKSGPITNIHLWASWLYDYPDTNAAFQLGFWSDVPITAGLGGSQLYNGTFELTFTNASTNGPLDGLADSIPPGWYRYETFSGGGKENSYIGPAADNGPSAPGSQAVMFSRTAGHTSGDWTAIYQPLAVNAGLYTHLYLTMDVRVWSHNLPAGGWVAPAFEWPAVVEIDYVDNTGHNQIWRHGWYLNPPGDDDGSPINDPGQGLIPFYNDTLVPEGVWTPNNFDLFAELPQVQTITRILVGGAGWDFFSEVDNVSIRASSTNAFSRPGNLLWSRVFAPGQYSYNSYPGELQPYYDPNLGSNGLIGSDMQVWQYDFPVLTNAAFRQTNGTVYWLSVSVNSQDYFGWKTAANRWNDDAVFGHVDNGWLPLRDWQELFDPTGTRSLDLAFSLTTEGMLLKAPVITNIVATNHFGTGLVVGFAWTYQNNASYQVFSTTDLGTSPILWSPCGPVINAPDHWFWDPTPLTSKKFYRIMAYDP